MFTKQNIEKLEYFIKTTLRNSGKPGMTLERLATDNCSEISRLVGCFALQSWKNIAVHILKGEKVIKTTQSHDILAIQDMNYIYVLDPSVWQFFPQRRSVLVGASDSLSGATKLAQDVYGGIWKVSEQLSPKSCQKEGREWMRILFENNKDAPVQKRRRDRLG